MNDFLGALSYAFSPLGLLASFSGVAGGVIIGSLPGLSATMAIALLIPVTFVMSPAIALLMLVGVYCGATYGGSISAILVGVPGTPAAAATWMDGYPMSCKGQGTKALWLSVTGSFVGGIVSAFALAFLAPLLAKFALRFGPPEYFSLAVFGLSIIVSLVSKSFMKGLVSALLGMLLACVGMDPIQGENRLTFDSLTLMGGIPFACAVIGLFGFSQALSMCQQEFIADVAALGKEGRTLPKLRELLRHWSLILRSAVIGTVIGIIPGAGTSMASFMAYHDAKSHSKTPELFGTGHDEGVLAPETSNNAVTGGSMVPMLALGIPGNGVSAIFIGALMIHGINPGPMLFQNHGTLVHTIFVGFFIANFFMLLFGLLVAKYLSSVTTVSTSIMAPVICLLCVIGTFAIRNNMFDVWVMIVFGVGGYALSQCKVSLIPLVLGLILAPVAEKAYFQSMLLSDNSLMIFLTRPISLALLVIALISIVVPLIKQNLKEQDE